MHPVTFRSPFRRTSQPLSVVAVIPARYASSRLPGKPLADIGGKPMIEHVYHRTAEARGVDAVVVATDDERIAAAVEAFGGAVAMTQASHRTGTDRIAEVARALECEIVINVQGDLPLIEPGMIAQVVSALTEDPSVRMSTLCRAITEPADYANPHVVKVVVDRQGDALYFSRSPIPYARPPEGGLDDAEGGAAFRRPTTIAYKHIGLYGYRRDFLLEFAALPQTRLELAESLEQLRALEHGVRIRTVVTTFESIEVDTADDLARVQRLAAAPAHAGSAGALPSQ